MNMEPALSDKELLAKQKRRKAFQKKLMESSGNRSSSPPAASDDDGENDGVEEEDNSEAEERVKSLHGKYASQTGAKQTSSKSKTQATSKKGKAEVGPSGQTYTPLENQARLLSLLRQHANCSLRRYAN